jgi:hypothetical protein
MNEEHNHLLNTQTWKMVGLPLTMNMVKNKWIFKKKEVVNSTEHQQKELAAKDQI